MKKLVTVLSVFTLSFGVFASTSFAASETSGTAQFSGGSLNIEVPASTTFTSLQLSGTVQTTTANLDNLTVVDSTGSGNGWNVKVTASPLQRTTDQYTLPENSMRLLAPTVTAGEGSSSESAIVTNGGVIDNSLGVLLLNAPEAEGKGTFNTSFAENALSLTLSPDTALAGEYSTTLTWNVVSGPAN
ncbi:WxL domain-containing protein [Halalkalibacter alkaliphilus]|uniref:WxL domain-containing protein n=1 Tax=Halalkalibacter alkaliphilus TaxID=2917993 RepID=A0A9X2CUP8_9BACI|nr:WxL domain-containing protein [Halalkalibacter alkaliphilus]MCL7748695.1 WxL domain-containing protein [Halalkalibacter alkaliphilus]